MNFLFSLELIKTDVTAVKLTQNHVLAGIGGFLFIYNKISKELIQKIQIFDGHSIYGISLNTTKHQILVFGGCYLKIYKCNINLTKFEEILSQTVKDWILTVKWLDNGDIAVVLMHNILLVFDESLQTKKQVICEEKCILYSAFICNNNFEELVVLSGTVFRELLIWWPFKSNGKVLTRLKGHKGVIFSVSYNKTSGYICSSSDDRSTILWCIKNKDINLELNQDKFIEINLKCIVNGHQSRVFRCMLLDKFFLTAGEDSVINIWDFNGSCIQKIFTHQGGGIWALDCNENYKIIATGGTDCGLTIFPIHLNAEECNLALPNESPKQIGLLNSGNFVVISESGVLFYFDIAVNKLTIIKRHEDLSSYVLLQVSQCRNLVSLSGYNGQIYIYKELKNSLIPLFNYNLPSKSRIFSFHWLTCQLFLTCEIEGKLSLWCINEGKIQFIHQFVLPPSKERWSTAACIGDKGKFIVGDRRGSLHLFQLDKTETVQSIKKAHNHLGVTNLYNIDGNIISLGRNAIVQRFTLINEQLELISSDKIPFTWLLGIVDSYLCAFSSNNFVVYDYKNRRILFEKNCGGGHRSWDFNKSIFVYIKDKLIHFIKCNSNNIQSIDIIDGYHTKEINSIICLKLSQKFLIISGSEDTTLRISMLNKKNGNSFVNISNLKSHLSSIRIVNSYQIDSSNYLLFSAGGRAQIICWKLTISNVILCSQQHSYYEPILRTDSEMRIMDLAIIEMDNKICVFAACSDGNIKLFHTQLANNGKYELTFIRNIFYRLKCIIKIAHFQVFDIIILLTMATDGYLVFWASTDHFSAPIYSHPCHQSGINSFSFNLLPDRLILLTGGDDNAVILNIFEFSKNNNRITVELIGNLKNSETHCAQVTGVFICDNYFLSTSIDQKLAIFHWGNNDDGVLYYNLIAKYNSSIPDIQGMQCLPSDNGFNVFLYGKGMECVNVVYLNP